MNEEFVEIKNHLRLFISFTWHERKNTDHNTTYRVFIITDGLKVCGAIILPNGLIGQICKFAAKGCKIKKVT